MLTFFFFYEGLALSVDKIGTNYDDSTNKIRGMTILEKKIYSYLLMTKKNGPSTFNFPTLNVKIEVG